MNISPIKTRSLNLNTFKYNNYGEGEIRTHGRLTPTTVFKTVALNHSATSPELKQILINKVSTVKI